MRFALAFTVVALTVPVAEAQPDRMAGGCVQVSGSEKAGASIPLTPDR